MPKLSLIIATYNRADRLAVALQSLVGQTAAAESWECIVVDNNSTDDTHNAVMQFAFEHPELHLKLVTERQQGLSHARNRGVAESSGEITAIIDDDEYVNRDFVRAYIDFFDANPACEVAGGRVIPEYPEGRPDFLSPYVERPLANPTDFGDRVRTFPRSRIPAGGNMAVRRRTLIDYGGFNPELGRNREKLTGGEESYLFERMRRNGLEFFYVPDAVIWHVIPPSKLTPDYLRRLAEGIGRSRRRRAELHGRLGRLYIGEAIKWCVTLLLALWYLLEVHPSRSRRLLIMRYHITKGIIH